jgi:malonate-semialdehyde dehydrogenase (acetylating)/methylmalonate-semialdehyde dehydrogenase
MALEKILNYIGNQWVSPRGNGAQEVVNPATQEILGVVTFSDRRDVADAVAAAQTVYPVWRRVPPAERVQFLYQMKLILESHREELARLITMECGKTLDEARAEMQRAIENVEVACGIPMMMQGAISEDIAPGIDELFLRQPVGICAIITPFNFPGMIPFWFLPYALACGNPVIIKPSESVPLTMQRVMLLFEQINLPPGVLNLVNGDREAVDALLDAPEVRAVSFVGSTNVARYIYARSAQSGKRAQCQGGAKNPVVILPDADLEMTTRIVADSAFGCAGQRCLAASTAIAVGDVFSSFVNSIAQAAMQRVTGYGMEDGVQMGPVINPASKARIEGLISKAVSDGAELVVDGRNAIIKDYEKGNFLRPTVFTDLPPASDVTNTEIFGPVLSVLHVRTIEDALEFVNNGAYGNMACLFTSSGSAARKFRYEAEAGNIGINIGVAAPIAYFPFSGWKDSFFGDLHGQALDAVDFFTQKKVVVERWPKEWSRKF